MQGEPRGAVVDRHRRGLVAAEPVGQHEHRRRCGDHLFDQPAAEHHDPVADRDIADVGPDLGDGAGALAARRERRDGSGSGTGRDTATRRGRRYRPTRWRPAPGPIGAVRGRRPRGSPGCRWDRRVRGAARHAWRRHYRDRSARVDGHERRPVRKNAYRQSHRVVHRQATSGKRAAHSVSAMTTRHDRASLDDTSRNHAPVVESVSPLAGVDLDASRPPLLVHATCQLAMATYVAPDVELDGASVGARVRTRDPGRQSPVVSRLDGA